MLCPGQTGNTSNSLKFLGKRFNRFEVALERGEGEKLALEDEMVAKCKVRLLLNHSRANESSTC